MWCGVVWCVDGRCRQRRATFLLVAFITCLHAGAYLSARRAGGQAGNRPADDCPIFFSLSCSFYSEFFLFFLTCLPASQPASQPVTINHMTGTQRWCGTAVVSGRVIRPTDMQWLHHLVQPLTTSTAKGHTNDDKDDDDDDEGTNPKNIPKEEENIFPFFYF